MRRSSCVAIVAVAAILAGCAGVPDHGKVHSGNAVPADNAEPDAQTRVLAHGPRAGAKPDDIVEGFLRASAGSDVDHQIARSYLTGVAGRAWQPDARAVVYDDVTLSLSDKPDIGAAHVVHLSAGLISTIANDGGYNVAQAAAHVNVDFRVVREDGEWRIANPPAGLLLTPADLNRSLRAQPVYFLNRDSSVVVPDTVFLSASGPGLPTALVRALLHGPTSWLSPAVRTAVPAGTTLRSTVPVDAHGTATVDLTQQALDSTAAQRQQMSAQIVWTLRSAPGVSRVRLLVEGNPLDVPTAGSLQSRDAWPTYDPAALTPSAQGYYRNGNRIVSVSGDALPGVLHSGSTSLTQVAISPDLAFVSGLRHVGARTTVYAGTVASAPTAVLSAVGDFTAPSWDGAGEMWTVQRSSTPQIWLIRPAAPLVRVGLPALRGADIRELRVSRDGTRVGVVARVGTRSELLVGRVSTTRSGALQLDGFREPALNLADVSNVSWADANTLLVLAHEGAAARVPWLVDVDGVRPTQMTTSGVPAAYDAAAAAPGMPTLVASGGQVYEAAHGVWAPLGDGSDPGYPG